MAKITVKDSEISSSANIHFSGSVTGISASFAYISGAFNGSGANVTNLNYSNITNPPTIGNATVTIAAGDGLTNGGSFTTNQTGNSTITLNVAAGTGIAVAADSVGIDTSVVPRLSANNTFTGTNTFGAITASSIDVDTIVAREYHTELVSASVIYQSGSTKFGDTSDDIHQFSGSIQQNGSVNNYFLGNVGIGTTSPTHKLTVNGDISGSAVTGSSALFTTVDSQQITGSSGGLFGTNIKVLSNNRGLSITGGNGNIISYYGSMVLTSTNPSLTITTGGAQGSQVLALRVRGNGSDVQGRIQDWTSTSNTNPVAWIKTSGEFFASGSILGSGSLEISGTSFFYNTLSGTISQFTVVSSSVVSASAYVGLPAAEVTLAGNNTFTGINTFNTNYITGSITGSDAKFTSITGSLDGNASSATSATTATNATNVAVTNNTSTSGTRYITFVDGTSGNQTINVDSSTLVYNAASNTLTVANIDGNASSATTATSATNATNATNIAVTNDTSSPDVHYVAFVGGTSGNQALNIDSSSFTYTPSTDKLAVGKLDVNGDTTITGSFNLSGSGHYVTGNVDIDGTLSATAKSFDIPHPTKKGMRLRYGSLESPYHGIRLTGDSSVVKGECLIYLPDYVSSLCKQEGSSVQVTNKKHGKVLWVEEINVEKNYFIIKTDASGDDENAYDFYWSFTAIRKDIEDLEVEIVI